MTNPTTDVAIIMGSDSDLPIVEAAFSILDSFGVNYTKNVMSCLLYTSPSPRDATLSRMPSSA